MAGLVFAQQETREEIRLFLKNLAPGKQIRLGEVSLTVTPELETFSGKSWIPPPRGARKGGALGS